MERLVPLCRVDQLSQLIEQERRTARGITGRSAETSLCRHRHKEVYGRKKRGVAYNHQGQRVGRPHVAAWAETEIVLAADLGSGTDDPRATAPDLLRRALACRPGPGAGWRCAPTPATSPGSSPASRMFGVLILAIYLVASRRGVEEGRISLSTKISKAEFSWKKHPKD